MNDKISYIVWIIYHVCLMALVFAVAWITGSAWAILGMVFTIRLKDEGREGKDD